MRGRTDDGIEMDDDMNMTTTDSAPSSPCDDASRARTLVRCTYTCSISLVRVVRKTDPRRKVRRIEIGR
jgi:hypothetical protein